LRSIARGGSKHGLARGGSKHGLARRGGCYMQALSQALYLHGMRMVRSGLQLSDLSKPLRTKLRNNITTLEDQLATLAPDRWADLDNASVAQCQRASGDEDAGGSRREGADAAASGDAARLKADFQEPCELVPESVVPSKSAPCVLAAIKVAAGAQRAVRSLVPTYAVMA
jgi:hypothetical protein